MFDEEKYEEALKIYSSLATIYEKGEYLYGCAAAYYMLEKYEEVLITVKNYLTIQAMSMRH